jgi:hypothetical protein
MAAAHLLSRVRRVGREPRVSYVLATFNGERFIGETIRSVLAQTHRNVELVVVDDGSTDGTVREIQAVGDPRLVLIRQPNMGVSFARNRGVARASGEYIGSIDQDDVFESNKTARQLQALRENGWSFCFSWTSLIDASGGPASHRLEGIVNQPSQEPAEVMRRLAYGNYFLSPSYLGHRTCYAVAAWPVGLFALQDYALWLLLWSRLTGGVVEERLVRYRMHDRNVSLHDWTEDYKRFEASVCVTLASLAAADGPSPHRGARDRARRERLLAAWLLSGGFPDMQPLIHAHALRAISLDPVDPEGYALAARALRSFGQEKAAERFDRMAATVRPDLGYPVPLVRGSWRRARPARRWPRS